jgi:hypothetical protein
MAGRESRSGGRLVVRARWPVPHSAILGEFLLFATIFLDLSSAAYQDFARRLDD